MNDPSRAPGGTSRACRQDSFVDGTRRSRVVPVGPRNLNVSPADVTSGEAQVGGGEGSVGVENVIVPPSNGVVIPDAPTRTAVQVIVERVDGRKVLVENDGLRLDLTDELSDNLLGHLAQYEEPLLNDLDLNGTADQDGTSVKLLDEMRAVVIVRAVEPIETPHRFVSAPSIEGE